MRLYIHVGTSCWWSDVFQDQPALVKEEKLDLAGAAEFRLRMPTNISLSLPLFRMLAQSYTQNMIYTPTPNSFTL